MIGFMFPAGVDSADVTKYMKGMKRAQMNLDLAPEKYKHYYLNEIPERYKGKVNVRCFSPGERIVFMPYTDEMFERTQAWIDERGLFERGSSGGVKAAEEVSVARAIGIPLAALVLMYMTIMTSAPQLLNSVIEEKMSRISEVLVGSITPFELMMGKLMGGAAASTLLSVIYIAGGLIVAQYWGGYATAITPAIVGWFLLFLMLSLCIFGSIFIAIGAACNDLKDSQNMMTPVMLLVMVPVFTAGSVMRAPDGTLATILSLVPTAAPFLMLLRISLQPGPPLWQIVLSLTLMAGTALTVVWAAGKIFRTGLLMQGKSATFAEMFRWVMAK